MHRFPELVSQDGAYEAQRFLRRLYARAAIAFAIGSALGVVAGMIWQVTRGAW